MSIIDYTTEPDISPTTYSKNNTPAQISTVYSIHVYQLQKVFFKVILRVKVTPYF